MNAPEPLLSRAGVTGLPSPHRVGAFEFQSVLARGDTGFVYRAWDHALARPVAIKEYLPSGIAKRGPDGRVVPNGAGMPALFERGREAFVDEARALARCDHPSLVRVVHLAEADGTTYRVMPLYAGRSLQELRRTMAGPPDEGAVRALLDDLLGALEAFHQASGPHGGVSAAQVLLLEDDRAVLLGSGAAMRALLPGGGTPPSLGADLHALASIARWCIVGDAEPTPGGLGVAEPLAATVDRLFYDEPSVHYSPTLLRALDIVLSPDVARRPTHPAQLREWLAGADMPAYAAPTPVDAATAGAIRRTIDAIPEPAPLPVPPPGAPAMPDLVMPILDEPRAAPAHHARSRRRRGRLATAGVLAAVLLGAVAIAAWQLPIDALLTPRAEPAPAVQPAVLPVPQPAPVLEAAPGPAPAAPAPEAVLAPPPPAAADARGEAPGPAAAAAAASADAELGDPAAQVIVPSKPAADPPAKSANAANAAKAAKPAKPVAQAPAARTAPRAAASPREQCGARSDFSLYRCMQQQCAGPTWATHAQCVRLRATDRID